MLTDKDIANIVNAQPYPLENALRIAYRLGWEARGKRDAEVCRKKRDQLRHEGGPVRYAMGNGADECARAIESDKG